MKDPDLGDMIDNALDEGLIDRGCDPEDVADSWGDDKDKDD